MASEEKGRSRRLGRKAIESKADRVASGKAKPRAFRNDYPHAQPGTRAAGRGTWRGVQRWKAADGSLHLGRKGAVKRCAPGELPVLVTLLQED